MSALYSFNKEHVRNAQHIVFHDEFPGDDVIYVESSFSGLVKKFVYDAGMTSEAYMHAEGWDGEENYKFYVNAEEEIIVEFWNTPYDGRF